MEWTCGIGARVNGPNDGTWYARFRPMYLTIDTSSVAQLYFVAPIRPLDKKQHLGQGVFILAPFAGSQHLNGAIIC